MRARILRRARADLHLTQLAVANEAGLSVSTVRRSEREGPIAGRSLSALCAVLRQDAARIAALQGLRRDGPTVRWTREMDEQAAEMWRRGDGAQEIADLLRVTRNAVTARMIRMGVHLADPAAA